MGKEAGSRKGSPLPLAFGIAALFGLPIEAIFSAE
jgi:DNA-binding XRE family transcriptional regulator